ncbi:MAG TPA: MerR family transcriptional regulator [Ottowia sp.]|uniref:MerR family transcriptional regulator n=1 Tax=Ottowia sp. TaxID=1898956 RepID=UPI002BACBE0B|nr:MerR family transcriptional regulator [Ottowia sp.]HMN22452.1 MerR family transcriptional regulator [Ottowia sp.]
MKASLPPIPAKRYFTIGEVGELCGVKPHVLRYWEQEFTQLRPMKRQGNRRYYQHHEVLMIRRIRELLYEQGYSISGARQQLMQSASRARAVVDGAHASAEAAVDASMSPGVQDAAPIRHDDEVSDETLLQAVAAELRQIRDLLMPPQ